MANLSWRDRISLLKAAAFPKQQAQQAALILNRIQGNQSAGEPPTRGGQGMLDSYSTMPWVRAVAGRVAGSMAAVEWRLYKATSGKGRERAVKAPDLQFGSYTERKSLIRQRHEAGELVEVPDHLLLTALTKGNGYHTGVALRRLTQLSLDLIGETFWLKARNALRAPVAFWPIPATWVTETPTPAKPTFRISHRGWNEDIPRSEVAWLCDPNPADPYGRGVGFMHALSDEAEIDEYAAKCHDDKTECLTRRGWVLGLDVTDDDEIATWNEDLRRIEYHRPFSMTKVRHDGLMHHWTGDRINAMVTPNHRMWIQSRLYARPANADPVWHFEQSRQVVAKPGRAFKWRDAGYYEGSVSSLEIPPVKRITKRASRSRGGGRPPLRGVNDRLTFDADRFAPFLGYYISEGSADRAGISISQTEGRYVDAIRDALGIFPAGWVKERKERTASGKIAHKFTVRHLGLAEWLRAQVGEGAANKRLPIEVFEWPYAVQRALLVALINGDGSWNKTQSCKYCSMSAGLIDDIQRLCVHVGWSSLKAGKDKRGLSWLSMKTETSVRHIYKPNGTWAKTVPYSGMVWCVSVPNEKFFTRRGNCVMLGGNTARQFFFNRAAPDFLVYPKGEQAEMALPEVKRFEQDWLNRLQGYWKSYKPYFLSREVGVYEFAKDMQALQLLPIRNQERDIILQVYGIPPEKFGILGSSNRSTIDESDLIYAKDVLVPRLEFWRSYFQERLIPEYDDRLIIDYVTPVMEDRDFALKAAQFAPWAMDGNEWRAIMGHAPKDEFDGVYFVPPAVTAVSADQLTTDLEPSEPDTGRDEGVPVPDGQPVKPAIAGEVGEQAVTAPTVSLNGAQVLALIEIITAVAEGRIPRETGVLMIMAAFALSRDLADQIMGTVGAGFVPEPPTEQTPAAATSTSTSTSTGEPPAKKTLLESVTDAISRMASPVIHTTINVPERAITVESAKVDVTVPTQAAPQVHVAPPVVHVAAPQVDVHVPAQRLIKETRDVIRDADKLVKKQEITQSFIEEK